MRSPRTGTGSGFPTFAAQRAAMDSQSGREYGLAYLQAKKPGMPERRDPVYLPQLLVTWRRRRSAVTVFDAVNPGAAFAATVPEFKCALRSDFGGKHTICLM